MCEIVLFSHDWSPKLHLAIIVFMGWRDHCLDSCLLCLSSDEYAIRVPKHCLFNLCKFMFSMEWFVASVVRIDLSFRS